MPVMDFDKPEILHTLRMNPYTQLFLYRDKSGFSDTGGLALRSIHFEYGKAVTETIPISKEELESLANFVKSTSYL